MFKMTNVLYIGNALAQKGNTSTTIDTLGDQLSEFCNVSIASNKSNKILRLLDMVWSVIKFNKRTDYVLIDTYSTHNFYYALVVSQFCRLLRIKYIPILHGGNLEKRLIHNSRLSKLLFSNANKLVAPSKFLESIFLKYGYDNLSFIPNSIEIDNYTYRQREINNLNLLWVRSFSSIYNPELALLVLEELKSKGLNSNLTMVGPEVDGSMQRTKALATEKKLDVKFTGKLSKKDWINLSKSHNIFINTTNIDNTPVSVIEAMALGLPVVSTNVGGIPYLIQDKKEGILVPPNDAKKMSDAILEICNDVDLRKLISKNARSKVEDFDWNKIRCKWQQVLD